MTAIRFILEVNPGLKAGIYDPRSYNHQYEIQESHKDKIIDIPLPFKRKRSHGSSPLDRYGVQFFLLGEYGQIPVGDRK